MKVYRALLPKKLQSQLLCKLLSFWLLLLRKQLISARWIFSSDHFSRSCAFAKAKTLAFAHYAKAKPLLLRISYGNAQLFLWTADSYFSKELFKLLEKYSSICFQQIR